MTVAISKHGDNRKCQAILTKSFVFVSGIHYFQHLLAALLVQQAALKFHTEAFSMFLVGFNLADSSRRKQTD